MRRLFGLSRIDAYIVAVSFCAALGLAFAWTSRQPFPGWWALSVFMGLAVLLDVSATTIRGGPASGSIVFLIQLPAIPLFGPFWAAIVTGGSTLITQLVTRRQLSRVAFNTAQKTVAAVTAGLIYVLLGAGVRPSLIVPGVPTEFESAIHTVTAFLAGSTGYFLVNSLLVCGAIAISSGQSLVSIWRTTSVRLFGYDIAASVLALFVAYIFLVLDDPAGLRRFLFLAVFAPIVLVKHAYFKLRTLQELYDELDTAHARLEQNVREQLEMMVRSIEARDPYTSGHSRRVAAISRAIAIDFGLSEELIAEVENAALLHDVGKIHAEFAPLLQKEGKLTPDEWELMKTHSERSAELVKLFSRFHGHVVESVLHHHERWDGLGYPHGTSGEQIPLGARIIMIADTIDAMTTDRPYRKALGLDAVLAELAKHRGTQFDGRLVDCVFSSVSVRRMISQPNSGVKESVEAANDRSTSPPLRSHGSFFLGRRLGQTGSSSP